MRQSAEFVVRSRYPLGPTSSRVFGDQQVEENDYPRVEIGMATASFGSWILDGRRR
jgi:hypothetical protein